MAALMKILAKAFWVGSFTLQTVCGEVVRPPTWWVEVEQAPPKGPARTGEAPTGVVASLPVSDPPSPTHRPYPVVPATRVAVEEGMVSEGLAMDLSAAFWERTVTTAPPGALVERRTQMWGTELTSEVATAEVVRLPRARVPPLPEKVPSQVPVWVPTLKVRMGSTEAEMLRRSSSTIVTTPEPLSSVKTMVYWPATEGFTTVAPARVTAPTQPVRLAVRVVEVKPKVPIEPVAQLPEVGAERTVNWDGKVTVKVAVEVAVWV